MRVTLHWICPKCGQPRGDIVPGKRYNQGKALDVDAWENPCGHVDDYTAIRREAAPNGLNRIDLGLSADEAETLTRNAAATGTTPEKLAADIIAKSLHDIHTTVHSQPSHPSTSSGAFTHPYI
jgi:hypothetical protein